MDIVDIFQIILLMGYVYYHNKARVDIELRVIKMFIFNTRFRTEIIDCFITHVHVRDFRENVAALNDKVNEVVRRHWR
jgi:hypothetical protein